MFTCLQLYEKDCGFACLKMLLANFYKDKSYLYMIQNNDDKSYSMKDLILIGSYNNLTLMGYEISEYNKIKTPCIGLVKINNINHYIYIHKIKNNYIYGFDPKDGKFIISFDEYKNISLNKYLLIDSFVKKTNNKKKKKLDIIDGCIYALLFIFTFLTFSLTYVVNSFSLNIYIYILFILFSIVLISLLLLLKLKKYDKEIIYPIITKTKDKFYVENEYLLKKEYFLNYKSTITNTVTFVVIVLFLLFNDFKCVCVLLFQTIYLILENHIKDRLLIPLITTIRLKELNERSDTNNNYIEADKLSYKCLKISNIISFVKIVLASIIPSLLICIVNSNYESLLTYSIGFIILSSVLEKIIFDNKIIEDKYFNIHNSIKNKLKDKNDN